MIRAFIQRCTVLSTLLLLSVTVASEVNASAEGVVWILLDRSGAGSAADACVDIVESSSSSVLLDGTIADSSPAEPLPAVAFVWLGLPSVGASAGDPEFEADLDAWLAEEVDPSERDRIEGFNRCMLRFNDQVYQWVIEPVTWVFTTLVPSPGRDAIRRAIANLRQPVIFANDLLQLAPAAAGRTLVRLVLNSTVGIAGLFDPAADLGFPARVTDFGQTMALYGTPSGTYIVVPVVGPTTIRDGFGGMVDMILRPETWLLGPATGAMVDAAAGFANFEKSIEEMDALRAESVDYYAALRAAYLKDRDAHVAQRIEWIRPRRSGQVDFVEPESLE